MSVSEDLINFDLIETHKENIQSLPQGRSARALVSTFASPSPFSPAPTPGATRNLNDAIRQEYELELSAISDSDDPLDIYDRYVKWTLNTYPSAQATPESQLRPLLERATKAFQTVTHYKNDPRYLKLWLTYIRFFSDSPKETFTYLARHSIGEGLALFYEEFAAWLESAGRWAQAEEVYTLGIQREARPAERLLRKFGEFQLRYEQRPQNVDEPSSPALPTVRPALAAKLNPFASSTPTAADPQAQRLPTGSGPSHARGGKQKLAIFSDAGAPETSALPGSSDGPKGWDNIGTIQDRKKENTVEARPWAGETLKAGKKLGMAPKMMIFKDEVCHTTSPHSPRIYDHRTNCWQFLASGVFSHYHKLCKNRNQAVSMPTSKVRSILEQERLSAFL
jgi:checkpoint serine/threonine-protein kinase